MSAMRPFVHRPAPALVPRAHRDDKQQSPKTRPFELPHPRIDAHDQPTRPTTRPRGDAPRRRGRARRNAARPLPDARADAQARLHDILRPDEGQARLPSMHAVLVQDERQDPGASCRQAPRQARARRQALQAHAQGLPAPGREVRRRQRAGARPGRGLLMRRRLGTGVRRRGDADAIRQRQEPALPGPQRTRTGVFRSGMRRSGRAGLQRLGRGRTVCEASSGGRSSSVCEGEGERAKKAERVLGAQRPAIASAHSASAS